MMQETTAVQTDRMTRILRSLSPEEKARLLRRLRQVETELHESEPEHEATETADGVRIAIALPPIPGPG